MQNVLTSTLMGTFVSAYTQSLADCNSFAANFENTCAGAQSN